MTLRARTLSGMARRRAVREQSSSNVENVSISAFASYIIRHARWPLARALGLLLAASATEGLSLLLIVPVISLLAPNQHNLQLGLPKVLQRFWPWTNTLHVELIPALVVFVILITARAFAVRSKDLEVANVLFAVVNDLRVRLFRAIAQSRWSYLSTLRSSDLNHALTADIDRIQAATTQLLLLVQAVIMVAVYSLISVAISPWMTLFALSSGLVILLVLQPIRRRARDYGKTYLQQRRNQFAIVEEFLGGMKMVKAANAEGAYIDRLAGGLEQLRQQTLGYMRVSSLANLAFQVATALAVSGFVAFAFLGAHLSRELVLIMLLLFLRIGPRVMALQSEIQDVLVNLSSFGAMRRLEAACTAAAEESVSQAERLSLKSAITLKGVNFRYPSGDRPALRNVSVSIPAGLTTAIIAPSGGGKSTLADLILGLQQPDAGRLCIDDVPLEGPRLRAWRNEVAYVPQDVFLLHDTLAANLRLTVPGATERELWAALTAAQIDKVVRSSPQGLDTVVGDRGMRLSGGERQRVALARALLRRPQLLILDEATSALDWENQAAVARVIAGLRGLCTVVTIAHRPSMIDFADWVIALDGGEVVEAGEYTELAANPKSHLARLRAAEAR